MERINTQKRRGPKPGQRHAGMFGPARNPAVIGNAKKGAEVRWSKDRRALVAMAQAARPESFDTVLTIMRNPQVEAPTRLRAAELVLAYSDGKPRQSLELSIGAPRDMSTLSTQELEAIAAGAPPPFALTYEGNVFDGEAAEVEATPARSAKAMRSGKASRSTEGRSA